MEPKWSKTNNQLLFTTGLSLLVLLVTRPSSAIEIYTNPEVVFNNGTAGVLRCTFKSSQVVSIHTTVTWNFLSSQPGNALTKATQELVLYYSSGTCYQGSDYFKDRVQFTGDINKRDVSIQIDPVLMSDNGTFICDIKNPPDVLGDSAQIKVRVVLVDSFSKTKIYIIVGAVCGGLTLFISIAACIVMRVLQSRHDYEGCTTLESVSSQAPKPPKKLESSPEDSRPTSPSGPLQGPVIYAQLDHSGSKNSFHKMEPVVYADIRKN